MEWEQDISMFDWFFTPNNTSSKVIAITIGTIKYCYNIFYSFHSINFTNSIDQMEWKKKVYFSFWVEWDDWMKLNCVAASSIKKLKFL